MCPVTVLVTPPTVEPLTLAETKLHLHVDHTAEDTLIAGLITSARQHVENLTERALITQTRDVFYSGFPGGRELRIPLGQLDSIGAFEWTDAGGVVTSWSVNGDSLMAGTAVTAHVDKASDIARIVLAYGQAWPTGTLRTSNPLRLRIVCGYGDATAVPAAIKSAMLLLVGHWFRNREAVVTGNNASAESKPLAMAVDALLAPYKLWMH